LNSVQIATFANLYDAVVENNLSKPKRMLVNFGFRQANSYNIFQRSKVERVPARFGGPFVSAKGAHSQGDIDNFRQRLKLMTGSFRNIRVINGIMSSNSNTLLAVIMIPHSFFDGRRM